MMTNNFHPWAWVATHWTHAMRVSGIRLMPLEQSITLADTSTTPTSSIPT